MTKGIIIKIGEPFWGTAHIGWDEEFKFFPVVVKTSSNEEIHTAMMAEPTTGMEVTFNNRFREWVIND